MLLKKIVAFILIMLATSTSFAQDIKGLGDFTIGMSVEDFLGLPLIKEKNLQDKTSRNYVPKDGDLWKTTVDSQVEKYDRVYSVDIVIFEFKTPLGVQNLLGKDNYKLMTKFYKDRLVQIYVSDAGMEFEKILTAKYGKPIKEDKTKRVICQNAYGAKSEHFDGSESTIWGKGKKISATFIYSFYECGKGGASYWVEDNAAVKIIDQIATNRLKAIEAEEVKIKASSSKL
jgi:hypothetical protein